MNKQEAILISAYTGYFLTQNFDDIHKFYEDLLGRPIFIHELANEEIQKEIKEKCKPLIVEMIKNEIGVCKDCHFSCEEDEDGSVWCKNWNQYRVGNGFCNQYIPMEDK